METLPGEMTWDGVTVDRPKWVRKVSSEGLLCQFDATHRAHSATMHWRFGQTGVIDALVAWQSLSPIMHRCTGWTGDDLFLKIVRRGVVMIEVNGEPRLFKEGDVVLVDPLSRFNETFREAAHVTVLKLPKLAFQERGLCHRFNTVCCPDREIADVKAVREFVIHLTECPGGTSDQLLARLGEQCLDLMDVIVNLGGFAHPARPVESIVSLARQVIRRNIGNPGLDIAYLAGKLNMSTSSLLRAMKTAGLSPMRYALALRLEHSAQLLRNMSSPGLIQQIAYQSGFINASHFSRVFKQRYGTTPREFHAAHQQAERGYTIARNGEIG